MRFQSAVTLIFASFAFGASASAGTVTLNASSQGWVNVPVGNGPNTNYVVGNCGAGDCQVGEYRNFFGFAISGISGTITSAALSLDTFSVSLAQSANITYQVTSLAGGFGFGDLGTGTFYGSRDYSVDDSFEVRTIALNQTAMNAIAAASGGTFLLGGRVSSSITFGPDEPNQLIFGGSDGGQPQLIINFSEGGTPAETPEPAPVLLISAGFLGLAACRRYLPASSSR